jgi:hypothetical protein
VSHVEQHVGVSLRLPSRLFTKAADAMDTKRIRDVAQRYRALQHIPGAIELTLSCISRLDPMDRALDYVRDGRQSSDKRKALFDVRQELYEEIITTLKHFDTALEKAVAAGGDSEWSREEMRSVLICCSPLQPLLLRRNGTRRTDWLLLRMIDCSIITCTTGITNLDTKNDC